MGHLAIGNSWRKPVPTLAVDSWGTDVRIGNRDSLLDFAFDNEFSNGHLFVALRHGSRAPHYSVCMSTDSGATWAETFTWVGSPPAYLDVAALRNHFYVLYNSPGENVHQVRLRRFLCSDGSAATFSTGAMWVAACTLDVGDTIREASLVSSRYINLYITALVSDGSVLFSVDDADGVSWVRRSTGITSSASNGLDATINQDSYSWFFFSYYDTNDTLRIHGIRGSGGFEQLFSLVAGRGTPTSISAYRDTVICAFEDETSSPHQVRYAINYCDGDTWRTGTLSNADTAAESPAVAVRGGRLAAVFRHYTPTRELRFCQQTDSGPWSNPVPIADNEPYWNRPAIQYLGTGGVFGVVYLSDTSPVVRGAYFDRGEFPTGVIEQQPQRSKRWPRATIVRSVLRMSIDDCRMTNRELLDIGGRKAMDLRPGANDVRVLAPGVYFVHSPSPYSSPPEGERVGVRRRPASVTKVVVTR
ncbi:MAG: hypothetical protein JW940_08290 [Polyangiaceae bacterium]|nr:hypothetical protein [Polyangiaceae bacterium]